MDAEEPKPFGPKWLLLAKALAADDELPKPLKLFELAPPLDDELSGPPKPPKLLYGNEFSAS